MISVCWIAFLLSCGNDEVTYADKVKDEQVLIDRFIERQGFVVLKEYPKGGVFGDKEFVRLENGVYLHVIDPGNSEPPTVETSISSLAKGQLFYYGKMEAFNGYESDDERWEWPLVFSYPDSQAGHDDYSFLGEGYMSALKYVGDGGSVSMIVPFSVGSIYQNQIFSPIYFEKVTYTFITTSD